MRKYLLLLFMFLFTMLHAQKTFQSVLQDGLVWEMEHAGFVYPDKIMEFSYRELVLLDDTLIDDIPFKRVYGQTLTDKGELVRTPCGYLIGQKDGRVYQYEDYELEEKWVQRYYPIMDFSLTAGDEFSMLMEEPYDDEEPIFELQRFKVMDVSDTVIVGSTYKHPRRCLYVKRLFNSYEDCWVEGIGSLKCGITGRRWFTIGRERLIRCSHDDEVLYCTEKTTHIADVSATKRTFGKSAVFDLQGRRLNAVPTRGMYIKDGRKYVK